MVTRKKIIRKLWQRLFHDFLVGDIVMLKISLEMGVKWKIRKIDKDTIYLEALGKTNTGWGWDIPNSKSHPLYKLMERVKDGN